jgi:hypothetical protein
LWAVPKGLFQWAESFFGFFRIGFIADIFEKVNNNVSIDSKKLLEQLGTSNPHMNFSIHLRNPQP